MGHSKSNLYREAFVKSIPVLTGYLFLGLSLGLLAHQAGISVLGVALMSLFVYAGALQFILVGFAMAQAPLSAVALMSVLISARHLFYGLSFLDSFRTLGWKKYYVAFALSDETYSLLLAVKDEDRSEREKDVLSLRIAFLNHLYWILSTVLGVLLGHALPFDFRGIEFSMTALFVVLLLNQVRHRPTRRRSALLGGGSAIALLLVLGPDQFLLPAILLSCALLILVSVRERSRS